MRRGRWQAYLFLAPAAGLLLTFHIYPLFDAVRLSLYTRVAKPGQAFAGLENYGDLLLGGEFWSAVRVTAWYVAGTVPVAMVLSLLIANLLFQKLRGMGLYRTIYFMPYVTSTVAAAMVWRWIFSPGDRGLANAALGWLGASPARWYNEHAGVFHVLADAGGISLPAWAAGPSVALVCVMVFSVWQALGFDVVVFLAGLSAVPREVHEAAAVDGAAGWRKLRYVTLPLLAPTLFFLLVVSVIRSFQTFNQIYVLTQEESVASTQTVTMLIFNNFYNHFDYGRASAAAVLLFAILMGLTLLQMRTLGRRSPY
jgi:multiple sugar transport system permease protein